MPVMILENQVASPYPSDVEVPDAPDLENVPRITSFQQLFDFHYHITLAIAHPPHTAKSSTTEFGETEFDGAGTRII